MCLINPDSRGWTFEQLKAELATRYSAEALAEHYQFQIRTRKRQKGETLSALFDAFARLGLLAYPTDQSTAIFHQVMVQGFISSLADSPGDLEGKLRDKFPKTLKEAYQHAVMLEGNTLFHAPGGKVKHHVDDYARAVSGATVESDDGLDEIRGEIRRMKEEKQRSDLYSELNALKGSTTEKFSAAENISGGRGGGNRRGRGRRGGASRSTGQGDGDAGSGQSLRDEVRKLQSTVNSMGQSTGNRSMSGAAEKIDTRDEELRKAAQIILKATGGEDKSSASGMDAGGERSSSRFKLRDFSNMECWKCGEKGHMRHQCKSEKDHSNGAGKAYRCSTIGSLGSTAYTFVRASIGTSGARDWLLDSGADRSVVPFAWIKHLPFNKVDVSLKAANDTLIPVIAEIEAPVRLWGKDDSALAVIQLWATEHITIGILGADFMKKYVSVWDVGNNTVTVQGHQISLGVRKETARCCRLVAQQNTVIPAFTECLVPAMLQYDSLTPSRKAFATELNSLREGICTARVVLPRGCNDLPMRVLNVTETDYRVRKGQELTDVVQVDVVENNSISREEEISIQSMVDRVDSTVTDEFKAELKQLLVEFKDVFSYHEFDLGRATAFKHTIDTGDAVPIRQRLRPQPRVKQDEIDRQTECMLSHGIIEESNSPWASNVVVVTKKDGSARVCVDYRKLNAVTRKDAYPLPRIADCLDALGQMRYFSSFDLRAGYWQMELQDDETKDRTSFITRQGSFRFNVLAFGLTGAPASFMRLMDTVMRGLNFHILLCYLDDIVVFSKDEAEHLERLGKLFERLRSSSLKLKPSKCQLLQTSIEFLGFIVSAEGIRTDPKKVETVRSWPRPINIGEVRSFVGLCSYYRKYVQDFAGLCAPLHGMTKKNAVFRWSAECEESFKALKMALTRSPVLAMPA